MKKVMTGLFDDKDLAILDSVQGQLSDGIWENTPGMRRYWENFDITRDEESDEIIIEANDTSYNSPFSTMTDEQIKAYFANKIKQIVKIEGEDNGNVRYEWDRKSKKGLCYLGRYHTYPTIGDCYRAYDILLNRHIDSSEYS